MLDHFGECDQLRTEELRTAAIMRQRDQRVAGVEIALYGAEIGFHRPEGGDDASGHTELVLGALEGGGVFLKLLAAHVQTALADGAL